jgi:PKD repeat protein
MKKCVLSFLFAFVGFIHESKAQCNFSVQSQTAGNVTFNHVFPVAGTLDFVIFDYGDGNVNFFPGNLPPSSSYTYATPGTYYMCMQVYTNGINIPSCVFCDSVLVNTSSPCASFITTFTNINIAGNTVNFANTSTLPSGYSIVQSDWDFDDGTFSAQTSPNHTYANAGTYNVCVDLMIQDAQGNVCYGYFCDIINVGATPSPCIATANFMATAAGSNVAFTNQSTCVGCANQTYSWDFGDASPTSNVTSPSHNYALSGTYNVCLALVGIDTAGNICFDTLCTPIIIQAQTSGCIANAAFSSSGTGLTKTFFNQSSCSGCDPNVPSTWLWDFGDGTTSIVYAPNHTYVTGNTYNVCLTMTGTALNGTTCVDTICSQITAITPNCVASALFSTSTSGLSVSITNTSTCTSCATATYTWDYGDGTIINAQNPAPHVYATAGTYTICLQQVGTYGATNQCMSDTCFVVSVAQTGTCFLSGGFTFTTNLLQANFIASQTCIACTGPITYNWNFGDATTATQASPTHTYTLSGNYNVCCIIKGISANGNVCSDTICQNVFVTLPIGCNAVANFNKTVSGGNVSFVNTSTCSGCTSTLYNWSFGDGGTSNWNSPSHTYAMNGTYTAKLIVTGFAANQTICIDSTTRTFALNAVGIEDVSLQPLAIYPNPTTNKVLITLPQSEQVIELTILDVTGRKVKSISYNNLNTSDVEVDLNNYTSGLYLIQLNTSNARYKGQVIKQ